MVNDSVVSSAPSTVTIVAQQRQVSTPDLTGLTIQEAEASLLAAGLAVGSITSDYSDTVPLDHVISQTPSPTTLVSEGSTVSLTISLGSASTEPSLTIEANPPSINSGDSTSLMWSSTNSTSVSIDNGIGLVPTNGTVLVSPEHTTTYIITAVGPDGAISAKVTVMVAAPITPQPEGSFGIKYEDLIPSDSTVGEYTPERFSLITGVVTDINNLPLENVRVTVHSQPEYGTVFTDSEGHYTIPVLGGSPMKVVFNKATYVSSHREIYVPWKDIAVTETAQLLQEDDKSTTFSFNGDPNTVISHTSTEIVDSFGSRNASIVFTGYNQAYVVDEEGNDIQSLNTITVRATEYLTPASMPAALPPTSAYTYCAEFKVDGVERVRFAKPIPIFIDNFLGFDVGEIAPVGFYDRDQGVWVPSDNGVVIMLIDTDSDGAIDALDSDGDWMPNDLNNNGSFSDEVMGLDDPLHYTHGATFWRVMTDHFTPIDINWPPAPAAPSAAPPNPESPPDGEPSDPDKPDPCDEINSYVIKRGRIFHEDIPLVGTNMTLHYDSSRVEGYKYVINIPASGSTVLSNLERIIVKVKVAGQVFTQELEPIPNQKAEFSWNGLDHLGRIVDRSITAKVSIGVTTRTPIQYQ